VFGYFFWSFLTHFPAKSGTSDVTCPPSATAKEIFLAHPGFISNCPSVLGEGDGDAAVERTGGGALEETAVLVFVNRFAVSMLTNV
jgi:hypothetical protein